MDELFAAILDTPTQSKEASLGVIREQLRIARDLNLKIEDSSESLNKYKKVLLTLKQKTLPDAFTEINIDNLGLPPEGNLPAYDAKLKAYYKACIPEEFADIAHDWLEDDGSGDIIKRTFTIHVDRRDEETTEKINRFLSENKIDYSIKRAVPWATLTAWLKERYEAYKRWQKTGIGEQVELPPLEIFGATVGHVVDIKERKDG